MILFSILILIKKSNLHNISDEEWMVKSVFWANSFGPIYFQHFLKQIPAVEVQLGDAHCIFKQLFDIFDALNLLFPYLGFIPTIGSKYTRSNNLEGWILKRWHFALHAHADGPAQHYF